MTHPSPPLLLAYWNIRGLAQPARFLLEYLALPYEEKRYQVREKEGGGYTSDWPELKKDFIAEGFDFVNLPYLIDGDLKIAQSNAVYAYLGRKAGLDGKDIKEQAQVDMLANAVMDLRNQAVHTFYSPKESYPDVLKNFLEKLPSTLKMYESALGKTTWVALDRLTWPDFHFYELLDQFLTLDQNTLKDFPRLQAYHQRFEALPRIAEYLKSDKFLKRPINNPYANWK